MPSSSLELELAADADGGARRERVRRYHERSKHRLDRYAPGPETLDWDSQPSPFRRFAGAPTVPLPRSATSRGELAVALARPFGAEPAAALPFSLATLGALFELSLGITAWKRSGPDRWAVRANPSSGNLHPVEAYAIVVGADFIDSGVHHYAPDAHALEQRAHWDCEKLAEPRVWVALTTITWREAWKYGERGFRYAELDVGHALCAVAYAARMLGFDVSDASHVGWATLFSALGLDRSEDYPNLPRSYTEREEPELLIELKNGAHRVPMSATALARHARSARFSGKASVIDAHPMYSWPAIQEVTAATRWTVRAVRSLEEPPRVSSPQRREGAMPGAQLLSSRRSAQRFDSRFELSREAFMRMLAAVVPGATPAAALLPSPMVDLVVFVHRVAGLDSGVYVVPRARERQVVALLGRSFDLRRTSHGDGQVEVWQVAAVAPLELARTLRKLCCHQDIASSCCFAVTMLADLERVIHEDAFAYRTVHREAGALGQTLYLEAEAEGVRGTGIGCFLDDPTAEFLGLADTPMRPVYHFSVGKPIEDPRIETTFLEPPDEPRGT